MSRVHSLILTVGVLAAATACKARQDSEPPQGNTASGIKQIAVGQDFTVALFNDGHVRLVGSPLRDADGEVREVRFGGKVTAVTAGKRHVCALLESGSVQCMGYNAWGALGYGHTEPVVDPGAEGDVNVGGTVIGVSAGHGYTCALLQGGAVRCWGTAQGGRLGYGSRDDVRIAAVAGDVPVGGAVRTIQAGPVGTTCAVMATGSLRCWGQSLQGSLGYGTNEDIGTHRTPESVGDIALPAKIVQVAVGGAHVCAVFEGGNVRCWGSGAHGRLGYALDGNVGDDETPMQGKDADIGGPVSELAAGLSHTCARLESGAVRCWGEGRHGQIGYGGVTIVGDSQAPAQVGDVEIGGPAKQLAASGSHTCALLESGEVMCWGRLPEGETRTAKRVRFG